MHHRVTAWVLGSCAAPAAMIVSTVAGVLMKEGPAVLLVALFWQGLLGFLILTLSLAIFSPVLLLPLEQRALSDQSKTALTAFAVVIGIGFMVSVLIGPLVLSILLGAVFDAAVFVLILARPNNTVERDEPQAARPSL